MCTIGMSYFLLRGFGIAEQMMDNFYRQYHTDTVNVACGYRTFDEQQALLDDEIAEKGQKKRRNG